MNEESRQRALILLKQKEVDAKITYKTIEDETGYSKRQLIRLAKEVKKRDIASIVIHGNKDHSPATKASDQEIGYIREFKKPYPSITITQFRDIYLEDVIFNKDKVDDVLCYGLVPRSISWFRNLFIAEGWRSPAIRHTRKDDKHVTHPIREPREHEGELIQIDGTPFDWFGDGRRYVLHLIIDDATTKVLAGWFSPTECAQSYAKAFNLMIKNHGLPLSAYSDKDSAFRSVKSGELSQFGIALKRLNIEMIFANSPQAKGRVERYNGTCQMRLPNDLIRFKVSHDYDKLNIWFNEKYIPYLNRKFSFAPKHPVAVYRAFNDDLSKYLRYEYQRIIRHECFSLFMDLYSPFDDDGVLLAIRDKTKITVYIDMISDEVYIERYGKHYTCHKIGQRYKKRDLHKVDDQRQLDNLLDDLLYDDSE